MRKAVKSILHLAGISELVVASNSLRILRAAGCLPAFQLFLAVVAEKTSCFPIFQKLKPALMKLTATAINNRAITLDRIASVLAPKYL